MLTDTDLESPAIVTLGGQEGGREERKKARGEEEEEEEEAAGGNNNTEKLVLRQMAGTYWRSLPSILTDLNLFACRTISSRDYYD